MLKKGAGNRFANTLATPFAVTRKLLNSNGLKKRCWKCWQKLKTSHVESCLPLKKQMKKPNVFPFKFQSYAVAKSIKITDTSL